MWLRSNSCCWEARLEIGLCQNNPYIAQSLSEAPDASRKPHVFLGALEKTAILAVGIHLVESCVGPFFASTREGSSLHLHRPLL